MNELMQPSPFLKAVEQLRKEMESNLPRDRYREILNNFNLNVEPLQKKFESMQKLHDSLSAGKGTMNEVQKALRTIEWQLPKVEATARLVDPEPILISAPEPRKTTAVRMIERLRS